MSGDHWKNLERRTAVALKGERLVRGADFSASEPDVVSRSFVVDAKSYARHAAVGLYRSCKEKYAEQLNGRTFLLVLHERRRSGDYVLLSMEDFADLARKAGAL